jgi:serine/threonine protein kinase
MVHALEAGDPRHAGKYRLLGRLGGGGMGQVFLGQSPGGRLVAVKLIRSELAGDPDFRARFAREVTTARTISGIFTVPVVDADVDGSTSGWVRCARPSAARRRSAGSSTAWR